MIWPILVGHLKASKYPAVRDSLPTAVSLQVAVPLQQMKGRVADVPWPVAQHLNYAPSN